MSAEFDAEQRCAFLWRRSDRPTLKQQSVADQEDCDHDFRAFELVRLHQSKVKNVYVAAWPQSQRFLVGCLVCGLEKEFYVLRNCHFCGSQMRLIRKGEYLVDYMDWMGPPQKPSIIHYVTLLGCGGCGRRVVYDEGDIAEWDN